MTVNSTELIDAADISAANDAAAQKTAAVNFRVYPYCTPTDGVGQIDLAKYTLASVENWERRNNSAVLNPQNRSFWEKEDLISEAYLAINAVFHDNPAANMHTLKTTAFSAIRAFQSNRERNSEREYNPGWIGDNIAPRLPRSTYPALDKLVKTAAESAEMTKNQRAALEMSYNDNMSAIDIAEQMNVKRATVYQTLYRAYYKLLVRALEIDKDMDIFKSAGYTKEDIDETLAILRKRARW